MYKIELPPNMRQKLITLCPTTWELASKKPNFSAWIRDQLRSERNKQEFYAADDSDITRNAIDRYQKIEQRIQISNRELLYHLENRSITEIKALVAMLKNGFSDDE